MSTKTENPLDIIKKAQLMIDGAKGQLQEKKNQLLAEIGEIDALLGIDPTSAKKPRKPRGTSVKVTPERVLEVLGDKELNGKMIAEATGSTAITVSKVLQALIKDKKIQFRKEGVSKFYKKR